jgi:hypothetical protein
MNLPRYLPLGWCQDRLYYPRVDSADISDGVAEGDGSAICVDYCHFGILGLVWLEVVFGKCLVC